MEFVIVLAATTIFSFAFRNLIRKHSAVFYVLAVGMNVLFLAGFYIGIPREVWELVSFSMQKCTLSLALFVVVMYIGVLPRSSRIDTQLRPIRAQLSIIAWILSLGHMAIYSITYIPRLLSNVFVGNNVMAAFAVAMMLFFLLLVLGVTSFQVVKRRMSANSWCRLQRLAYLFYGLVYVHLIFMLAPAAARGGSRAIASVIVYSTIFVVYVILRAYRACKERRTGLSGVVDPVFEQSAA